MKTIAALKTPHHRDEWEKRFDDIYIQPILETVHKQIKGAMKLVLDDNKHGINNNCVIIKVLHQQYLDHY